MASSQNRQSARARARGGGGGGSFFNGICLLVVEPHHLLTCICVLLKTEGRQYSISPRLLRSHARGIAQATTSARGDRALFFIGACVLFLLTTSQTCDRNYFFCSESPKLDQELLTCILAGPPQQSTAEGVSHGRGR